MISEECWTEIDAAPRYLISDEGKIWDLYRQRYIRTTKDSGYVRVRLETPFGWKAFSVHRLVVQAFLHADLTGLEVNHLDGNTANNYLDNLEVCTHSQNVQHSFVTGRKTHTGGRARKQVVCTSTGDVFMSVADAARYFNLLPSNVSAVLVGRRPSTSGLIFAYRY